MRVTVRVLFTSSRKFLLPKQINMASRLCCQFKKRSQYSSSVAPFDDGQPVDKDRDNPMYQLKLLLDYISVNIDQLRVLDPVTLEYFEARTKECWECNHYNFERILTSHGWTEMHGWAQSLADFDSLLRNIGNYYLLNKCKHMVNAPGRIKASSYLPPEDLECTTMIVL